ncbi:MAG: hypothetical protein MJ145_04115 [Clostridia bacterium]|nr:hypothetical protein [Clostridia bacterium]
MSKKGKNSNYHYKEERNQANAPAKSSKAGTLQSKVVLITSILTLAFWLMMIIRTATEGRFDWVVTLISLVAYIYGYNRINHPESRMIGWVLVAISTVVVAIAFFNISSF